MLSWSLKGSEGASKAQRLKIVILVKAGRSVVKGGGLTSGAGLPSRAERDGAQHRERPSQSVAECREDDLKNPQGKLGVPHNDNHHWLKRCRCCHGASKAQREPQRLRGSRL